MRVEPTDVPGLLRITPRVFRDERGFFLESYNAEAFAEAGVEARFVQDNHAKSAPAGVLRGFHFQAPPNDQAKLVWVVRGAVFDAVVDLREGSPTFGQWRGFVLSEENFLRLFIPRGFAHGYLTLRPDTEFMYKVDATYAPQSEGGLRWNDPDLAVDWPLADLPGGDPILSEKDEGLPLWREFETPFGFAD